MCCNHDPRILAKFRKRKKPFVAWKILSPKGTAMYYGASEGRYGPGFNYAKGRDGGILNRSYNYPTLFDYRTISYGLHLYRAKKKALKTVWAQDWGGKVVRVLVDPKDVIGAGLGEIAAVKVRILQKDWKASKMPTLPAKTRVV